MCIGIISGIISGLLVSGVLWAWDVRRCQIVGYARDGIRRAGQSRFIGDVIPAGN